MCRNAESETSAQLGRVSMREDVNVAAKSSMIRVVIGQTPENRELYFGFGLLNSRQLELIEYHFSANQ